MHVEGKECNEEGCFPCFPAWVKCWNFSSEFENLEAEEDQATQVEGLGSQTPRPHLPGPGMCDLDGPIFESGSPVWNPPRTSLFAHLSSDHEPCLGAWRVSSGRPLSWQN